jgi:hypothetical protein
MRILLINIILLFSYQFAFSSFNPDDLRAGDEYTYHILLKNGDMISGSIIDFYFDKDMVSQPDSSDGIKVKTELGNAIILFNQINDITLSEDLYRHDHRIFLMPTANPIKNNLYVGNFEVLYFQAGFGISDYLSFNVGRTLIPSIPSGHQLTEMNGKWTFYNDYIPDLETGIALAVGGNLAYANSANRLIHIYASGTFKMSRSQITTNVFYKTGSQDYFTFMMRDAISNVILPDGAFGVSLGLDTKLPGRNDIHFIGEIWNVDVMRPTNSSILMGFRIANRRLSADFGLALFTNPFLVPFTSFTWTLF